MWEYTEKVKEHYRNPRNVGEIENPDGTGEVGSIVCGDALKLTLKVKNGVIADAKFKTFGCGSAIASASALTEMIKGRKVEEAAKITNQDIADFLGGLPREKMHCSVLGREALEAALADWRGEKPRAKQAEAGDRIVCECFQVTEDMIRRVARANDLRTVEDVTNFTKAGGGCGKCVPEIEKILAELGGRAAPPPPKRALTNLQRIRLIEAALDGEVRPSLQQDGGDLELVDVAGKKVTVRFQGTCSSCPASGVTLRELVEKRLREAVGEALEVEEARDA